MTVTIITCFIVLEPAVVADPPDGARSAAALSEQRARETELVAARARDTQLTTRALAAAHAGDCPAVISLEPEIRDLDRAYYALAFAPDPAIIACTGVRSPPDPPIPAVERVGPVFGSGLALSRHGIAQGELRVGWMARPQLAVFFTVLGAAGPDEGGYHLVGMGTRAGIKRLFVDLRIGGLTMPSGSDLDYPRVARTRFAWSAGLGLELVHLPRFGLELGGGFLGTTSETLFLAGLGLSFYP